MEGETRKELAQKIRSERQRLGISQSALAKKMNLNSTGSIGNWESGITSPDYTNLCVLADLFNVSTDYLLGRDENRTPYKKERMDNVTADEYEETYGDYADVIRKYECCDELGRDAIDNCINYNYKRCMDDSRKTLSDKRGAKKGQKKKIYYEKENIFLKKGESPDYDEMSQRVIELRALKKKSYKSYYDITSFLWHAGYGDNICMADVMGVFGVKAFGKKVPCRQLYKDIEAFLKDNYFYTVYPE